MSQKYPSRSVNKHGQWSFPCEIVLQKTAWVKANISKYYDCLDTCVFNKTILPMTDTKATILHP